MKVKVMLLSAVGALVILGLQFVCLSSTNISTAQTPSTVSLAEFMQSSYSYTHAGTVYIDSNSMLDIHAKAYHWCSTNTPYSNCLATVTREPAPVCTPAPSTLGCLAEGDSTGVSYKFGFNSSNDHLREFSKGGYPGRTLEVFWYDDEWVYAFSQPDVPFAPTPASDQGDFESFSHDQDGWNSIKYPNRGSVWYRNNFEITQNPIVTFRYDGPSVVIPDNYVYHFHNNLWYAQTVWTVPGTIGVLEGYYYPSLSGWGRTGDSLPDNLDILQINSARKVSLNGAYRFFERYSYARQTGTNNYFGLVRFEKADDHPEVCGNPTVYPNAPCEGTLLRDQEVDIDRLRLLTAYPTAYANATAWWSAVGTATPKNDPKLKKIPLADVQNNRSRPPIRGGFTYPGAGNDVSNAEVLPGQWIFLENDLSTADWFFTSAAPTLGSGDRNCPSGYTYGGSIYVWQSMNDWGTVDTGNHWIKLCRTTNDVYIGPSGGCAPSYSQRGWWRTDLGGGVSCDASWPTPTCGLVGSPTAQNFCVKNSQCVGTCFPNSNP